MKVSELITILQSLPQDAQVNFQVEIGRGEMSAGHIEGAEFDEDTKVVDLIGTEDPSLL